MKNLSPSDIQVILNSLQSNVDLNSCLINCSNQGLCKLDSLTQNYFCECNENFQGKSCETDIGPCNRVNNKCLNNATCLNVNFTSISCECPSNGLFYGQYCENRINSCGNVTCSLHGYCFVQNQTKTKCKCFYGYSGDKCDIESNSVKTLRYTQWTSTIICIICMITFCILIIGNDVLNYFKIGNEKIDINEWREEKLHGKSDGKIKNTFVNKGDLIRFKYVNWDENALNT